MAQHTSIRTSSEDAMSLKPAEMLGRQPKEENEESTERESYKHK